MILVHEIYLQDGFSQNFGAFSTQTRHKFGLIYVQCVYWVRFFSSPEKKTGGGFKYSISSSPVKAETTN